MSRDAAAGDPRRRRLAAVGTRLAEGGSDGLLLAHPPNVRYLTGFSGSSALLLVLRGADEAWLLTDFRYEEQAGRQLPPQVRLHVARDGLFAALADLLEAWGFPLRLWYEADHLSVRDRRELGERCGGAIWEVGPPIVEELRRRKEPAEISCIEAAARLAEEVLEDMVGRVEEGVPERELAIELEYRLKLAGSGPLPFEPIVASGPNSALPHAEPGQRRLAEGDLLLVDFGASVDGYVCDLTRTFVLGAAAEWQRELHAAVSEARDRAVAAIAAGVPACEVDRQARGYLEKQGLGDRFGHGTGHGIGLEVHEAPRLARTSEDVLGEGDVVTVEPGVYLSERGGVRIEDDVLTTGGGPRVLSRFSRDLLEL